MKIALVSEHASPLAVLGGVDAGGQNVHVDALARHLGQRGHDVCVYTRRDDESLPERVPLAPGVTVVHVPAGPPRPARVCAWRASLKASEPRRCWRRSGSRISSMTR